MAVISPHANDQGGSRDTGIGAMAEEVISKPMSHHQVSTRAAASSHRERVIYLQSEHVALVEDLLEGFKTSYRRSWALTPDNVSTVETADEMLREMDSQAVGARGCRFIVVRDAHRVLRSQKLEVVLSRLEMEERNARLFVVMIGDDPPEALRKWLEERKLWARFREPTIQSIGKWLSARAIGEWRYHRLWRSGWFQPEWGVPFMDHVGWSYAAALQGLRSVAVFEPFGARLEHVLQVVPPVVHSGYVDALTLRRKRSAAVRMAAGVLPGEMPRVLGALRYRLRLYGAARAIGAELYGDRDLAEKLGVDVWWWRDRFKDAYPNYTENRIRRRLAAVAEAETMIRSGVTVGVLEAIAVKW